MTTPMSLWRRAAIGGAALLIAACTSPALPPAQWWRLPAEATPPVASAAPTAQVWQLVGSVPLPGHLDRDTLLVPDAAGALQPVGGARWAEPLRDAVPRLLRHDLAQLRGEDRVWAAPLPATSSPAARLRVEVVAFEAERDGAAVLLVARWSLVRADGGAPTASSAELRVPVAADAAAARADALVLAHRQALRMLAERIAATR
jgi:hypothetical protein